MNWYIGQKIVAVKDHSKGRFAAGEVFTIKDVRDAICGCDFAELNIGKISISTHRRCGVCTHRSISEVYSWFSERSFAPIEPKQELSEHTTETLIEELEEQLQPC